MVIAPRAREASVQISLQFDRRRTVDSAAQDVRAAINATAGQLPPTMPNPSIHRNINPADTPVLMLALTSETLTLTEGQRLREQQPQITTFLSVRDSARTRSNGGNRLRLILPAANVMRIRSKASGETTHAPVAVARNLRRAALLRCGSD
jgi:hypothetical protein